MKAIILILSLAVGGQDLLAQVSLEFETRKSTYGDLQRYGSPAPFVARFRFEKEPAPLDTVLVHYSLEVMEYYPTTDTTWQLRIEYQSQAVQLIGDSIITWDAPHKIGETYEGTLKLIPLRSGLQAIYIYRQYTKSLAEGILMANGVSFEWCMDQDGNVTFVGASEGRPVDCNVMRVVYFDENGLAFYSGNKSLDMFDYTGSIQSVPAIGDTVVLSFQLTANRDLPAGYDFHVLGKCSQIISGPQNTGDAIFKGDTVEMELRFIPLPLRGPHKIFLHFESVTNPIRTMMIPIAFVFGEDGGMRYALDNHISVPIEMLPKSYRQGTNADDMELRIKARSDR